MKKIWDGKKIEKIFEEILSDDDKLYFITTFQHADNSITEKIMHLQQLTNGDIHVIKQIKTFANINEYKKDTVLIEDISANNKQSMPIKNFLKQQHELKIKPNKIENMLWITSIVLPTIAIIIGLFYPAAIVIGAIGLAFKTCTSFFSPSVKKVESWWYNAIFKNQEQKEKEKKEYERTIKNLTSDKKEIRLETQFQILKQKLNNRKYKSATELLNNDPINQNLNANPSTINNFDLSTKNAVNDEDQPSTSTTTHHSNSIS